VRKITQVTVLTAKSSAACFSPAGVLGWHRLC
jgi:hypothetical protein